MASAGAPSLPYMFERVNRYMTFAAQRQMEVCGNGSEDRQAPCALRFRSGSRYRAALGRGRSAGVRACLPRSAAGLARRP
jgi:hypothetical protein